MSKIKSVLAVRELMVYWAPTVLAVVTMPTGPVTFRILSVTAS